MMDRTKKLELIERSLGIRHKLKVFDSSEMPGNHEELSLTLLKRWDLEDELQAIEETLAQSRRANVAEKKSQIEANGVPPKRRKT